MGNVIGMEMEMSTEYGEWDGEGDGDGDVDRKGSCFHCGTPGRSPRAGSECFHDRSNCC